MKHPTELFRTWDNPPTEEVGDSVEEFLRRLGGPTWIDIRGKDPSRTRTIVTLLHGNEPSGVRAIHQWLRVGIETAVNIVCFIGAVEAALAPPGFAFRTLPGSKDLNRCWREPFERVEGHIAEEVLSRLQTLNLEALVDLHNTSGRSPCYAITTQTGDQQKILTALFANQLVITDLRLGSLMEATELQTPTIVVECGGNHDHRSDQVAFEGLLRYIQTDTLFSPLVIQPELKVFKHPIRVELQDGITVAYANAPVPEADCTFRVDADYLNFDLLHPGDSIGWIGPKGLDSFSARDAQGNNRAQDLFTVANGEIHLARTGRILMMTTDPAIAYSDCLFYFLPCSDF